LLSPQEGGETSRQENHPDIWGDFALSSSSSSESLQGESDDEGWMVLDECFDKHFLSDRGNSGTPLSLTVPEAEVTTTQEPP